MTSASELFNNRRSRIGRNELGFGSSSPNQPLAYHFHNRHHNRHRHRTSRHHDEPSREEIREEMEDCDLYFRRSAWHPTYRDHGPVQVDHLPSHVSTGSSSGNVNSSIRANRMQFTRSDQLPGDVLLARERLFERLRGVSLSSNRQSSRSTSGITWDEVPNNEEFRLAHAEDELDFISTAIDRLSDEPLFSSSHHPLNVMPSPQEVRSSRMNRIVISSSQEVRPDGLNRFMILPPHEVVRPAGLIQHEINSLLRESFTIEDGDVLPLTRVTECSICLNSFEQGDDLIRLPCQHRFHETCLCPWVQICGDCPNCRAAVVVANH